MQRPGKESKVNNCKIFSWLKKNKKKPSPNKQAPLQNPSHVKKTQKEKYLSLSESAIRICFHEFKIRRFPSCAQKQKGQLI